MTTTTISPPSPLTLPPRWGTRRRPERPTVGPAAAVIAARLGRPFLPWQHHTANVLGELLDDGTPAYRTGVVSVGRRAGKSLLVLATCLRVTIAARQQRVWYSAQSRADAALTFKDDWVPMITDSPLARFISPRLSNGSEALLVPGASSMTRLFAPTPAALHGQAGDLILFDEAWAHDVARGRELMIAARPLMATRPHSQQWILSAAGDIDSSWWAEWTDLGRQAADADTGRGIAYLEWSGAHLDPANYSNPDVWCNCHPAVRHPGNPAGTITLDWLADEYAMDPAAFVRVYLNVQDRDAGTGSPIDLDAWDTDPAWTRAGNLAIGVHAAPEQATGVIVAAGIRPDGVCVVELVDRRPGTDWIPARLDELADRYPIDVVTVDRAGPAGDVHDAAIALGLPVRPAQLADVTAAASALVQAIRNRTCARVPSPVLDDAAAAARRRPIRNGAWTFDHTTDVDVSPIIAASLARAAHPALHGLAGAVN